eukprot:1161971-Pelagomonas_calceolata.AAC.8
MGNGHTLGHEDFMLLTSGVQFSPLDKQDWIKGVRFLVTAMQKSGPMPTWWSGRGSDIVVVTKHVIGAASFL